MKIVAIGVVMVGLAMAAAAVGATDEVSPASGYPATVRPLSRHRQSELQKEFRQRNLDVEHHRTIDADIDRYGRISSEGSARADEIQAAMQTSEQQVLAAALEACARNKRFVGVADVSQLKLNRSTPIDRLLPGGQRVVYSWRIDFSVERKVEGIPMVNAGYLVVWLDAYGVRSIQGSGLGDVPVVVPKLDAVTASEAKRSLIGRELTFSRIDGERASIVITEDSLKNGETEKVVLPLVKDDRIEMRIVWKLGVGQLWTLYVDTTTGEVVKEEQLFRT